MLNPLKDTMRNLEQEDCYLITSIMMLISMLLFTSGADYQEKATTNIQKTKGICRAIQSTTDATKRKPFDNTIAALQESQNRVRALMDEAESDMKAACRSDFGSALCSTIALGIYQIASHKGKEAKLLAKVVVVVTTGIMAVILAKSLWDTCSDLAFIRHYFCDGLKQEIATFFNTLDYKQFILPYH